MPNVATPVRDLLAVIEGYAGALESPPDQGAEAIRCSRSNALFCDTSSTVKLTLNGQALPLMGR